MTRNSRPKKYNNKDKQTNKQTNKTVLIFLTSQLLILRNIPNTSKNIPIFRMWLFYEWVSASIPCIEFHLIYSFYLLASSKHSWQGNFANQNTGTVWLRSSLPLLFKPNYCNVANSLSKQHFVFYFHISFLMWHVARHNKNSSLERFKFDASHK